LSQINLAIRILARVSSRLIFDAGVLKIHCSAAWCRWGNQCDCDSSESDRFRVL